MCTSLTLTARDQTALLARTMDFPNVDPWIPRTFQAGETWQPYYGSQQKMQTTIVGASRYLNQHYLLGDGMNADGLACAELYLPNRVVYYDEPQSGKINLTPQDFIMWVLGSHRSVSAVVADLPRVALVGSTWFAEGKVYPFHWIIADKTGASVVIEPTELILHATKNRVGVLTNTPTLPDHEQRLQRYLGVTSLNEAPAQATALITAGEPLPTGPVPTRRFIRTAINRLGHPTPSDRNTAVEQAFEYLNQVVIPKNNGAQPRNHNFTHYRAVMDLTHLTYYFIPTETNECQKIRIN